MKSLVAGLLMVVVMVVGLSIYLAPDGLSGCGAQPDAAVPGCDKVDAIVAVSGGDTSARTAHAIELYKYGWADRLVFSGAAQDKTGPSNAEAMRRQAVGAGVDPSVILVEELSETTAENAVNTSTLFAENDISEVILVTSAYHQRRAGLEFGKLAGSDVRIINHPVPSDRQWSATWWLTPGGWWLAGSEFFKIMVFYMGGSR